MGTHTAQHSLECCWVQNTAYRHGVSYHNMQCSGGTITDDEDMAWGEQAQLAVEENAPHKKFPMGPGGNPKTDRRSTTGSNFMRSLPDRYSCGPLSVRLCSRLLLHVCLCVAHAVQLKL